MTIKLANFKYIINRCLKATLQTGVLENFRYCRGGAERRVPRAQTPKRGLPSVWAENSTRKKNSHKVFLKVHNLYKYNWPAVQFYTFDRKHSCIMGPEAILYILLYLFHSIYYTLFIIFIALYSMHFILCNVFNRCHSMHCIYSMLFILCIYFMHCTYILI